MSMHLLDGSRATEVVLPTKLVRGWRNRRFDLDTRGHRVVRYCTRYRTVIHIESVFRAYRILGVLPPTMNVLSTRYMHSM